MQVISNQTPRDTITWDDLTAREKRDFDYLDSDDAQIDATFVRYRGATYDVNEFMASKQFPGWDGYHGDTYFSAILIRLCDGRCEQVIMGRAYS